MSQYLGGSPSGCLLTSVVNYGTGLIPRGRIVSLYPDADMSYTVAFPSGNETRSAKISQGYGAGFGFKVPIQEWVVTTKDYPVGVTVNPIAQGEEGTVVVLGPCIVETDGTPVAGDKLQIAAAGAGLGGVADVFAAGQAFGVALSTDDTWISTLFGGVLDGPGTATATYALCYVTFTNLLVD